MIGNHFGNNSQQTLTKIGGRVPLIFYVLEHIWAEGMEIIITFAVLKNTSIE